MWNLFTKIQVIKTFDFGAFSFIKCQDSGEKIKVKAVNSDFQALIIPN